ncbi:hypothetical protein [Leuconostoc citreum]
MRLREECECSIFQNSKLTLSTKKRKKKTIKIPKAHTLNLGRVRSIVLLILIGLFIYFSYVLLLANATAHKNKTLQQTVATLNQRINQENAGTPVIIH